MKSCLVIDMFHHEEAWSRPILLHPWPHHRQKMYPVPVQTKDHTRPGPAPVRTKNDVPGTEKMYPGTSKNVPRAGTSKNVS
jgi:hypothetical protein